MTPNKFIIGNVGSTPPPEPTTDLGYIVAVPYATSGNVYISEDLGQTWRTTFIPVANNSFFSALIRGDTIMINRLGSGNSYPHYSLDRGYNFTDAPYIKSYPNSLAISKDKQVLAFSGDGHPKTLIMSLDGGSTWFEQETGASRLYGTGIGNNGQYMYSGQYVSSGIRYTADYRSTWQTFSVGPIYDLCCSSNGQYIYAGSNNTSGRIEISHDYGQTWFIKSASGISTSVRLKCSEDGKYVLAHSSGTSVSHDYGITWTSLGNIPNSYIGWSHNVSPSGKYMVLGSASAYGTYHISEDYGITWTTKTIPNFGSFYPRAISIC